MKYIVKFWEKYKFVFFIFLIWRIGLLVIGYWSIGLLSFKASFPFIDETLISSGFPQWLWQWGNFDGVHYLSIAKYGYDGLIGNEQVFFPLYPYLIKLLGGSLLSALLISNCFALIAGLLFYKYFGKWAMIFFYSFPTAFFLGSIYTESLLITFLLLSFYKSKIFGIFAGLTKFVGGFSGVFGAIGVAIYALYLKMVFGDPFLFIFHQGGFNNARANTINGMVTPFQTVFRYLKIIITADPTNIAYWVSCLELFSFIFAILFLICITMKRKFNFWILAFCWLVVLVPSLTGTLTSVPRYILLVFPLFSFLGGLKNMKLRLAIIGWFIIMQTILTVLFLRGYFVA